MLDRLILHHKTPLKELGLVSGDKLKLFASYTESSDLQLNNEPRAAVVKAESMRLMEQLQKSLKELKRE
jgi:hypothetical protein